jgi:hypothetical protein
MRKGPSNPKVDRKVVERKGTAEVLDGLVYSVEKVACRLQKSKKLGEAINKDREDGCK